MFKIFKRLVLSKLFDFLLKQAEHFGLYYYTDCNVLVVAFPLWERKYLVVWYLVNEVSNIIANGGTSSSNLFNRFGRYGDITFRTFKDLSL